MASAWARAPHLYLSTVIPERLGDARRCPSEPLVRGARNLQARSALTKVRRGFLSTLGHSRGTVRAQSGVSKIP